MFVDCLPLNGWLLLFFIPNFIHQSLRIIYLVCLIASLVCWVKKNKQPKQWSCLAFYRNMKLSHIMRVDRRLILEYSRLDFFWFWERRRRLKIVALTSCDMFDSPTPPPIPFRLFETFSFDRLKRAFSLVLKTQNQNQNSYACKLD